MFQAGTLREADYPSETAAAGGQLEGRLGCSYLLPRPPNASSSQLLTAFTPPRAGYSHFHLLTGIPSAPDLQGFFCSGGE